MQEQSVPHFWWLWLPVLFMVFQIGLELSLPREILAPLHSETGPHETLQAVSMFAALFVALRLLWRMDRRINPWLTGWVSLAALCCLYVGGEEISWGQHLMDWSTPDYWARLNDQGETNLHNTSSWLDQKPRLILLVGVITGGLLIPALRRWKPDVLPRQFAVIYPPSWLWVTALGALAVELVDKIDDLLLPSVTVFERASEVEELYLFYFVLLYLIALSRRILQDQR